MPVSMNAVRSATKRCQIKFFKPNISRLVEYILSAPWPLVFEVNLIEVNRSDFGSTFDGLQHSIFNGLNDSAARFNFLANRITEFPLVPQGMRYVRID